MSESAQIVRIEPDRPDPGLVREVAGLLLRGGVVGLRTDTVYGLVASVHRPDALRRLIELKVRPPGKPFILLASGWLTVRSVTSHLTPVARILGSRYWPGPLTLVLPADEDLPEEVTSPGPEVAVRVPADVALQALLGEVKAALAAPSANRPGEPPARTAEQVAATFGSGIDLVVDGGEVDDLRPSTIVHCAGTEARLVREGRIALTPRELRPV